MPRVDASLGCAQLRTMYDNEIGKARSCYTSEFANSCTTTRKEHIDCGCSVFVSTSHSDNITTLDVLSGQWNAMNCMLGVVCPLSSCQVMGQGACVSVSGGVDGMCM